MQWPAAVGPGPASRDPREDPERRVPHGESRPRAGVRTGVSPSRMIGGMDAAGPPERLVRSLLDGPSAVRGLEWHDEVTSTN